MMKLGGKFVLVVSESLHRSSQVPSFSGPFCSAKLANIVLERIRSLTPARFPSNSTAGGNRGALVLWSVILTAALVAGFVLPRSPSLVCLSGFSKNVQCG